MCLFIWLVVPFILLVTQYKHTRVVSKPLSCLLQSLCCFVCKVDYFSYLQNAQRGAITPQTTCAIGRVMLSILDISSSRFALIGCRGQTREIQTEPAQQHASAGEPGVIKSAAKDGSAASRGIWPCGLPSEDMQSRSWRVGEKHFTYGQFWFSCQTQNEAKTIRTTFASDGGRLASRRDHPDERLVAAAESRCEDASSWLPFKRSRNNTLTCQNSPSGPTERWVFNFLIKKSLKECQKECNQVQLPRKDAHHTARGRYQIAPGSAVPTSPWSRPTHRRTKRKQNCSDRAALVATSSTSASSWACSALRSPHRVTQSSELKENADRSNKLSYRRIVFTARTLLLADRADRRRNISDGLVGVALDFLGTRCAGRPPLLLLRSL